MLFTNRSSSFFSDTFCGQYFFKSFFRRFSYSCSYSLKDSFCHSYLRRRFTSLSLNHLRDMYNIVSVTFAQQDGDPWNISIFYLGRISLEFGITFSTGHLITRLHVAIRRIILKSVIMLFVCICGLQSRLLEVLLKISNNCFRHFSTRCRNLLFSG